MDRWTPSWRGSPFRVGARYRTLTAIASIPREESLVAGEEVVYQQSGYSRYDSLSVYSFVNDAGEVRTWCLHDDHPMEGCARCRFSGSRVAWK